MKMQKGPSGIKINLPFAMAKPSVYPFRQGPWREKNRRWGAGQHAISAPPAAICDTGGAMV